MTNSSRPSFRRICSLTGASAINALCLAFLSGAQAFAPENIWPLALILFAPQQLFVVPSLIFFWFACRKKRPRVALANGLSLLFCSVALLNFNFPLASKSAGQSNAPNLRVMNFNIRYGSLGMPAVCDSIARENPDVICLQEAIGENGFPDPLPQLKKRFAKYDVARYGQLVILSRFPIGSFRAHRLPTRNGCGILEARIIMPQKTIAVYNAHFINPIDSGVLQWARQIQIRVRIRRQQLALLARLVESPSTPYIIAGDFNTPPRGRLNRGLKHLGSDAFAATGLGFGNTFPAFLPVMRIDRIFSGFGAQPVRCRVLPARASDHRALVCDFHIGELNKMKG